MNRNRVGDTDVVPNGPGLDVNPAIRMLVHDAPLPMAVIDLEGHAWIWNAAAETLFPPPPCNTNTVYPLFSLGTQPWFDEVRSAGVNGHGRAAVEWTPRGMGGARYRLRLSLIPVRDADQSVCALMVQLADRTNAERQRRIAWRKAQRTQRVLDQVPEPLLVHEGGCLVYANKAAARLLSVKEGKALLGLGIDSLLTTTSGQPASSVRTKARAVISGREGATPTVEMLAAAVRFGQRRAVQVTLREVEAFERVSPRKQLERSRASTTPSGTQGVILLDAVGFVTSWDAGAQDLTGFRADEIVGRDLSPIYAADDLAADGPNQALNCALTNGRFATEGWKRRKDGTRFWCQLTVNALLDREQRTAGFAVVLADFTNKREGESKGGIPEDQLRQGQRMEAIGRLAGGIAHDFNNLLTAIQGHAQFLIDDLAADSRSSQDAQEIKRSADRAAGLTRQLLAFSRRQQMELRVVDLNEIMADMGNLLRRVIDEDILLQTTFEENLWPVRADPGQIEQVVLNLVVNARDALPGGGTIALRTTNLDIDEEFADRKLDLTPGPYVLLTVSDNGVGMDQDTQAHIFEPFFTTKEPGKGTGLGLATVYGIVKQSGGHIWVYSEPGRGTTFKIFLPRVAGIGDVKQRQVKYADAARPGETVLLIEDEVAVRTLARRVLESRGFKVLDAGTGAAAVRIAEEHDGPIHLMLCDVVLPDMNGREIGERIIARRAETRPLFMSGYTDDDAKLQGVIDARAPFLEKPFTPDLLTRRVREVLDSEE
jgi:two-component system, cell cycle sensor histidine kinase and response regulator CckA